MPKSRNRKLTRNEKKARKPLQRYRQGLHRAYLALIGGALNREQFEELRNLGFRELLLGRKAHEKEALAGNPVTGNGSEGAEPEHREEGVSAHAE